jgi:metal-sulfur cluster biosynthetic enzyme
VNDRSDGFATALEAMDAVPAAPPAAEGPDPQRVWAALGTVIDPELGLDLVTLGLVYDVSVDGGQVRVTFTLTTPGCPMEAFITEGVAAAVREIPGVADVEPVLVWEPAWNPGMIREGAW